MPVLVVACLGLAACSSSSNDSTATPSASSSDSTSPTPSASTPADSDSASADPSATPASSGGTPTCATSSLRVSVQRAGGGGAAGSRYLDLSLRNAGSRTCAMTGWPGVSYVTGSNGRQVGAAADRQGSPTVIRVGAGRTATARLQVASPANFENCRSTEVRGYRVYPPNQKDAVFVSGPTTACASGSAHQLTIQPVQLSR